MISSFLKQSNFRTLHGDGNEQLPQTEFMCNQSYKLQHSHSENLKKLFYSNKIDLEHFSHLCF